METRNIFENLSCIDHRYSLSEKAAFDGLSKYISEQASIRSCAKCEAALVKAHLKVRGKLTDELAKTLDDVAANIDPEEVYAEEEKTKHNIRALVNVMKTKVNAEMWLDYLPGENRYCRFVNDVLHIGKRIKDLFR